MRGIVSRLVLLVLLVVAAFAVSGARAPSASACDVWCWGPNLQEGSGLMQWFATEGDEGITPIRATKVTIIRSTTSWDNIDGENLDDGIWVENPRTSYFNDYVGFAESKHANTDSFYLNCPHYNLSDVKFGSFWVDGPDFTGGCIFNASIGAGTHHTYGISRCLSTGNWCTFNENGNVAVYDLTDTMGSTAQYSTVGEDIYCSDFCDGEFASDIFIRSNHGYCGDSSCAGDLNYKISDEGETGGGDWTIETAANAGIEVEKDCEAPGAAGQWAYDDYVVNSTWDIHWKTNGTDC
jgi:hypothetical protein